MTTTYLFGKANRTNVASMQRQAVNIIKSFFVSSNLQPSGTKGQYDPLVGKPMFSVTPDKVIVQLFYYIGAQDNVSDTTVAALGDALTRCWGRTVELRLVRLNHTVLDSSIFAQYLTENSNKYSFNRILDMIKTSMPFSAMPKMKLKDGTSTEAAVEGTLTPTSDITGVKIKLSGRLTTQRSGPRQTVQSDRLGSSGKGVNGTMDNSQHTSKNKLGAFTIKVWVSGSF